MFEARLVQGNLLKKVVDAVKDLVTDANFDCNETGFQLQAMDNSHVSLVAMQLRSDGFEHFRCDRNMSMGKLCCFNIAMRLHRCMTDVYFCWRAGMSLNNLAKILKCAGNEDIVTMKAADDGDTVTFMFESPSEHQLSAPLCCDAAVFLIAYHSG